MWLHASASTTLDLANRFSPALFPAACRLLWLDPAPPRLPVGERTASPVRAELPDKVRLNCLSCSVRRLTPRNDQAVAVGQLPDIPASPMADRSTGTMPAELVETFR